MCVAYPTKFLQGLVDIFDPHSLPLIVGVPPLCIFNFFLVRVNGGVLSALGLVRLDSGSLVLGSTFPRVTAARLDITSLLQLSLAKTLSNSGINILVINVFTNICMSFHHIQSVVQLQGLLVLNQELRGRREEGGGGSLAWAGPHQTTPTGLVANILYAVALVRSEQRLLPVEGGEAGVGRFMFGHREARVVSGPRDPRDPVVLVWRRVPVLPHLTPRQAGAAGEEVSRLRGGVGGGRDSQGRGSPGSPRQIIAGRVVAGGDRVLVHPGTVALPALRLHYLVEVLIEDLIESHWVLILATHCED